MKLIKRGAEAVLYKTKHWKQDALLKKRIPKKYRTAILDEKIRKQRTKQEAILLHHAKKATVRTPTLLKVDKKKHQLWMEWIPGKALKTVLGKQHANWCKAIGKKIALLHTAGIIHGDLTTSNIIVSGKELVFVDFGLGFFSNKIEDRAVDLV
ncbi:Kae1-associated serine/threonine protein kinase, partial [Candidatus Micrarchaeota archaeon]|nr:Kae1-associated serine/threonine protein kinase [Candidatus Micrarchaeota archaeon]MBU1930093.1 Kae1-associated serine/threonine protein kinase [Candidatus Micrarchaeota archaeon]